MLLAAVEAVAGQVGAAAAMWQGYDWTFRLDMAARLALDMPTMDSNPDQLLFQGV